MHAQIRESSRGLDKESFSRCEVHDFHSLQAWVKKVNSRWLVHSTLKEKSREWMDYLENEDHFRWKQTCRLVWNMMQERGALEDPKPRFYGALFALAQKNEALRFLREHHVTRALIPCCQENFSVKLGEDLSQMSPETIRRFEQLRQELKAAVHEL